MKIEILKSREVDVRAKKFGTISENKVEKLEFIFPKDFEDYTKTIEFKTSDGKSFVDRIENDEYIIQNSITKYKRVYAQVVLKNLKENIIFKSKTFEMSFYDSINATEDIEKESQGLLDKIVVDIQKVTDRVEALERDNTTNKANIKALQNNKVDKQDGKDLSTNDFTNEYKNKLDNLKNYDDTDVRDEIATIREKNNLQDEEINAIKQKNTEQDTEINLLKDDNTQNKTDIQTNAEHIQNNAENIASANIAIEALHEKNVSQDEALEQLRTETNVEIAELQKENKALKSQIPTRTSKRRTHTFER